VPASGSLDSRIQKEGSHRKNVMFCSIMPMKFTIRSRHSAKSQKLLNLYFWRGSHLVGKDIHASR